MIKILNLLITHKNIVLKTIFGLSIAILLASSIILYKLNKILSESLEMVQNNIDAYLSIIANYQGSNYALMLKIEDLENNNDKLILKLDSVAKQNLIKLNSLNTAATQTQTIYVTDSKEISLVEPLSTILTKYKTYTDSIQYNDLTTIHYTIGEDTVSVALNVLNTQYLYVFKEKEWKNKKNFFKRLVTLDFKKVWKYRYDIINTNDLINTSDVRVIEVIE